MLKYITPQHAEYLLIKSVFFAFFLAMAALAMPIAAIEHDLRECQTAIEKWENPDGKPTIYEDDSDDKESMYVEEDVLEGYAVTYYPRE